LAKIRIVDRKLAALEAFNNRPRERKRIRRLIQSKEIAEWEPKPNL